MPLTFKARIRKTGPLPFGGVNAYVVVPKTIVADLLKRAGKNNPPIPIRGTVEGKRFATTLVRYEGTDRVYLNMRTRRNSGVDIGDVTSITLQLGKARVEPMSKELAVALSRNKKAEKAFEALAPSRRAEILRYLNSMKTQEGLDRNIGKVIKNLSGQNVTSLHSLLPDPGGRRR